MPLRLIVHSKECFLCWFVQINSKMFTVVIIRENHQATVVPYASILLCVLYTVLHNKPSLFNPLPVLMLALCSLTMPDCLALDLLGFTSVYYYSGDVGC